MDSMTNAKDRPHFARVKVEIKVGNALKRLVKFVDENERVVE